MLFLGPTGFPTNQTELTAALLEGLARWAALPETGPVVVDVSGGEHPGYERLSIDLTGAATEMELSTQHPIGIGQRQAGFTVNQLQLVSRPLLFHHAKVYADLTATSVRFDFDHDATNWPVAVLANAAEGTANCRIGLDDLDSLLLRTMQPLLSGHGITIEDSNLHLQSSGGRSLEAKLRLSLSKKMFLTIHGVVAVSAHLEIDDELNAIVRSIACHGEGAVGSTIAGIAAPFLKHVEGTAVPLSALPLGEVQMRDVQVHCGDELHIHGTFSG